MIGATSTPTFGYYNPVSSGADPSFFGQSQSAFSAIGGGISEGVTAVGAGFQAAGQFAVGSYNALSGVGERIRPFFKAIPPEVTTGHGGLYMQPTSFFQGLSYGMGFGHAPREATPLEYGYAITGDFGERVGGGLAAAGLMAAPIAATAALGMIPGGRFAASLPSRATMAVGRGLGGMIGSPFGATGMKYGAQIGRGAGWLAAPMALYSTIDSIQESIQDRLVNQGILEAGAFRFVGAGSEMSGRLGSGMRRSSRRELTEFMRQQDIRDPFFGDEDMRQILQESMRSGFFVTASNTEEFKKRFKDIKEGVKTMMKTLNVSLEEGLATMKDLSSMGTSFAEAPRMAILADMTGRVAGKTGSEMITLGLQGAELLRGTGISMDIGFQSTMMNLAAVRAARDSGWISKQMIAQLGGEEATAQMMTQQGVAYAQSALGRGMMASFYDPKSKGFDVGGFKKTITAGGEDITTAATRAAGNIADPANLVRYQARQEEFLTEAGEQFGGRGLQLSQYATAMGMAKMVSRTTGANMEDSFLYALKEGMGMSDPQAKAALAMIRSKDESFGAAQAGASATASRLQSEEAARRSFTYQMSEKFKDWYAQHVSDPIGRPITAKINEFQDWWLQFSERNRGMTSVDTTEVATDIVSRVLTTEEMDIGARNYDVRRTTDLSEVGTSYGLGKSVGDEIAEGLKKGVYGKRLQQAYGESRPYIQRAGAHLGMVTLKKISLPGQEDIGRGLTPDAMSDLYDIADVLSMGMPEVRRLKEKGELKTAFGGLGVEEVQRRVKEAFDVRKLTGEESVSEIASKVMGGYVAEETAKVITPLLVPMMEREAKAARNINVKIQTLQEEQKTADGARREEIQAEIKKLEETGGKERTQAGQELLNRVRKDKRLIDLFGEEELNRALKGVSLGGGLSDVASGITQALKLDAGNLSRVNTAAVIDAVVSSGAGREGIVGANRIYGTLVKGTEDYTTTEGIRSAIEGVEQFRKDMSEKIGFDVAPRVVEGVATRAKVLEKVKNFDDQIKALEEKSETAKESDRVEINRNIEKLKAKRAKSAQQAKDLEDEYLNRQAAYEEDQGKKPVEIESRRALLRMYSNAFTEEGRAKMRQRYESLAAREGATGKQQLTETEAKELGALRPFYAPKEGMLAWITGTEGETKFDELTELGTSLGKVREQASYVYKQTASVNAQLMGDALSAQLLESSKSMDTKERERIVTSITAGATSYQGFKAISPSDIKAIHGTDIGTFIETQRRFLGELSRAPEVTDKNFEAFQERLSDQISDPKIRTSVAKVFKDQGKEAGLQAYYNLKLTQFKGEKWTSAVGVSSDMEQTTALKHLEVQTNVNVGVLMALSGLAAQLGVSFTPSVGK